MLQIVIPEGQYFDNNKNEFIYTKEQTLQLEHSLISISKWESKWHKPFLGKDQRSVEEVIDYVKCMTINQNVNPIVYSRITQDQLTTILEYINSPMTATTFNDRKKPPSRQIVTSELIYYWMVSLNIPMECEKWHLNRLLTLIHICDIKNSPPKKMSKKAIAKQNSQINAERRARMNSSG